MKRILTIGILFATTLIPVHAATAASPRTAPHALARFGSAQLDLGQSWGSAKACLVQDSGVTCFATEADLNAFIAAPADASGGIVSQVAAAAGTFSALSECGTYLRLYSSTGYGGSLLAIATELNWINLSAYGFDNTTSSYRIGDCAATFRDGSNGGGATYTGPTGAGVSASSMVSGWDNRVSSIYIS